MKLGGLFSGVGGFELAWTQLGHEVAWMCEWDKNARKMLEARFPGVPIYPDVRDLDPAEVEAVDVLTGGSPCQGFSVAGTRSGLEHSESQLFADYVRIMDGLAERGLKYAIWENVPGVLSITNDDGERTFEHVVAALAGGTEPVRLPTDKRWNTGLAAGRGRAVAWRVLDSRYFGVAQRRRRVFACVAFGDSCEDRAGRTLLAVAEGVRGDSPSGVEAGEGAAGGVAGRAGVPSFAGTVSAKWAKGTGGPSGDEVQNLVTDAPQAFNWQQGDAEYSLRDDSSALAADSRPAVMIPQAFRKAARAQSSEDGESWVEDGQANTLNVFDVGDTRTTHAIVEPPAYGVRRLTPVECERLQSFPDGWTEPAGSDSARYKAMGNAVTVNVVRWILGRLP
jgi:DNA (cytosine-5)-methyltransferase 1